MSVLFVAVPVAIGLGGLAVVAFLWALHQGQWDDLDSPQQRMLQDDIRVRRSARK